MTEPLSVDLLLALDDGSARETAYQVLADQALSAPSLKPIFSSRCPADLPPTNAEWVDSVGTATCRGRDGLYRMAWIVFTPSGGRSRDGSVNAAPFGP
jgi:hypothetical protein